MSMNTSSFFVFTLLSLFYSTSIFAEIDFVRDVKPVLEHNCVSCHREGNVKGNVRLDTKAEAFKGDDVIVVGNPEDS